MKIDCFLFGSKLQSLIFICIPGIPVKYPNGSPYPWLGTAGLMDNGAIRKRGVLKSSSTSLLH